MKSNYSARKKKNRCIIFILSFLRLTAIFDTFICLLQTLHDLCASNAKNHTLARTEVYKDSRVESILCHHQHRFH